MCINRIKPLYLPVDIRSAPSVRADSSNPKGTSFSGYETTTQPEILHRHAVGRVNSFVFPPHLLSSRFFHPLLPIISHTSDPGSQSRLISLLPSPLRFLSWKAFLSREYLSPFPSLADSHRITPIIYTHAAITGGHRK